VTNSGRSALAARKFRDGHLATFISTLVAGDRASLAVLDVVIFAFGGAVVTSACAHFADFGHERRGAAEKTRASPANVCAVDARLGTLWSSLFDALRAAALAFHCATDARFHAGLVIVI
jgi:hypothetical protein